MASLTLGNAIVAYPLSRSAANCRLLNQGRLTRPSGRVSRRSTSMSDWLTRCARSPFTCAVSRAVRLVRRIAEARHPVVVVVHRVIDAIGPVEADAARRNSQVMVKAGEVGPAAQVAERQRRRITLLALQPDVVHSPRAGRIGDCAGG